MWRGLKLEATQTKPHLGNISSRSFSSIGTTRTVKNTAVMPLSNVMFKEILRLSQITQHFLDSLQFQVVESQHFQMM
jgi:hypothetical protein